MSESRKKSTTSAAKKEFSDISSIDRPNDCSLEQYMRGLKTQLDLITRCNDQMTSRLVRIEKEIRNLQQRSSYPGQRAFRKIAALISKGSIFTTIRKNKIIYKNRKLNGVLQRYGYDNTGVSLEKISTNIIKILPSKEAKRALVEFKKNNPITGFEIVCNAALPNPKLRKSAYDYLSRVEAVIRCSRIGMELPNVPAKSVYDPTRNKLFYLAHMRGPIVKNGYSARTSLMLEVIKNMDYETLAITRLGFPHDLAAYKNVHIDEEESINGTRFIWLPDEKNGMQGRPIDDLISTYGDRVIEHALIERPGLIHAASNYINGLAAIIAARKLGIPSIYEVRGLWQLTQLSRNEDYDKTERFALEDRMEMLAVNEADRVVVISEGLKQYFIERGIPNEKLFVVPNGVNIEQFQPLERDTKLARKLEISPETVVIGYVGSLVDYEGLDILLEAAAILRDRDIDNFRLLIVGAGKAYETLTEKARALELDKLCHFAGPVPREEVQAYYSLIDIAPFPRKMLPVTKLIPPLKPMEAMAMGSVVMVSDLPALSEIGVDGSSSIHFKSDDVTVLANSLEKVLASKELRDRIGRAGRKWVMQERSVSALGNRLKLVYDSLIHKKTSA
jgi:glycosyltransferase involved in cell wall biosynthesis